MKSRTVLSAVILSCVLSGCGGSGTTVIPDFDPAKVSGTYSGSWHNLTFGTTGSADLTATADTVAKTASLTLTLGGNVFGSPGAAPLTITGSYSGSSYSGTASSNTTFGNVTLTIDGNGNIIGQATNIPGGTVSSMTFQGSVSGKTITLNYTVVLVAGGTASGTVVVTRP
ncbi:MAG: hypothetical protein ABUL49_00205 [bacterium]